MAEELAGWRRRHVELLRRRRTELQWYRAVYKQQLRGVWTLRKIKSRGRHPVVFGKPVIDASDLEVGDDFKVWSGPRPTLISGWGRMRFGDRCFVNVGSTIISVEEIVVGDDVAFANDVYVMDSDSHGVEGRVHKQAPIVIGDGCWIGARAMILPGV
ncbi:MAG: lacA 2, partial [Frankiales bacterium]|nr:lacA 2 [Frankiales bacterium]